MIPKSHLGYIIRDLLSGKDNYSLDIGRVLWAVGMVQFFGMSMYALIFGLAFDYISWSAGFGAILASGGAALKLKESTEPTNKAPVKAENNTVDAPKD